MKWKRSKKAQQEAKAKAAADRAAKQNGTAPVKTTAAENKSKRITEEDEVMSSDNDDEDIDVGGEDDSDSMACSPTGSASGGAVAPSRLLPPSLVAPTPILGLPHPPALQLRPLLQPAMANQTSLVRPPLTSSDAMESNLSALLPAHLARLSQAAASGNRLYRPFVA